MVGADKQLAAQILFQIVHAAGNVGLVVAQSLGGLGKAFVLGNIVKNAVIIVGNSHFFRLRAISFRYVQHIKYTFYIFLLEQYNTGVLRNKSFNGHAGKWDAVRADRSACVPVWKGDRLSA